MVRAPCCASVGLKKGLWTTEEDQILISHIQKHGHANWRSLPKQAGLLRCGKSCRLRWINYLNPDIKRGNFSSEEEEKIIQLHQKLGNKWSKIAAKLPGRTDNEIKNVWHSYLKKTLNQQQAQTTSAESISTSRLLNYDSDVTGESPEQLSSIKSAFSPSLCPQQGSVLVSSCLNYNTALQKHSVSADYQLDQIVGLSETFSPSGTLGIESNIVASAVETKAMEDCSQWDCQALSQPVQAEKCETSVSADHGPKTDDGYNGMEFWCNVLFGVEGITELPDF